MVVQVLQKRQEPWRWGVQWLALGSSSDQLRGSSKLILLQLQEKLLKNATWTILWSFGIWSKLERWNNSSGCLMSWPQIKKNHFEVLSFLILHNNNKPFLDQIGRAAKSAFYTTTSNDQLSGWTKKKLQSTPQSQTHQKKGHGHCLVVCCPSDPLQLSESQWNDYMWGICSANWWDAPKTATSAADISPQKGPNSSPRQCPTTHRTTNASKVEQIGL